MVSVGGSRTVTEEPKKSLVIRTLRLHFAESLRARTQIVRERDARVSFSSEYSPAGVVEATSRSAYMRDMDEKCDEYARSGIATNIAAHREANSDCGFDGAVSWAACGRHGKKR